MLKVLIAPTAFKGTLSPVKVAEAIETGLVASNCDLEVLVAPLSDGGDGTLESLHVALGGNFEYVNVSDALGQSHSAAWLCLPGLAVVELASVCGLGLMSERKLAPLEANTFGLGEMLKDIINKSEKDIVVALGGSASTDGGTGALRALGARFLGSDGDLQLGGGYLNNLVDIDLSRVVDFKKDIRLRVAVDVTNPLLGPNGAASVFGAQKGASGDDIKILETGLTRLADLLAKATGRDVRNLPGVGAAGGTAFGLVGLLEAELVSGFALLSQLLLLDEKIRWADLVITAEGRFDGQSFGGKVIGELAQRCKTAGKPLYVIAGELDNNLNWQSSAVVRAVAAAEPGKFADAKAICDVSRRLIDTEYGGRGSS